MRVYYLAWLRNKILHNDPEVEKKQGWTTVGEMEGCVHYKVGEWQMMAFYPWSLLNSWEIGDECIRHSKLLITSVWCQMALCLFCLVKYERIKFLVIALKNAVEVYAWAPKPYHKFMAFKVSLPFRMSWISYARAVNQKRVQVDYLLILPFCILSPSTPLNQSFSDLPHRPVLVDLTVEEGQRLKVIYGSCAGFHAIDVDSGNNYDIYIPVHVSFYGNDL